VVTFLGFHISGPKIDFATGIRGQKQANLPLAHSIGKLGDIYKKFGALG